MAELDPKSVQKELEQGLAWPVYWIHGPERMKSRELVRRIRKHVLGQAADAPGGSFNEEWIDGPESNGAAVVDAARSLALGGGTRLILVRDAHALKEPDALEELLGPRAPSAELPAVCVFLSKDLDKRRKLSKRLLESAAVVACEGVPEEERPAWIQYLARRRGLSLSEEQAATLRWFEPWALDAIDQELEKWELASLAGCSDEIWGETSPAKTADQFMQAFFGRKRGEALELAARFADRPDESLPLLGLLAWNARHLVLAVHDREKGSRSLKLSPFLAERFSRWAKAWSLAEALALQRSLHELDFSIKQTARLPQGLWAALILQAL